MRISQKSRSKSQSSAAPVGGLNARDAIALMPPSDAVTMTNFFPTPTTVDLRNGSRSFVTGLPADIESLMRYRSATATKLFAASGTAFYDVTTAGVVGAAVVSGLANARWQTVNMGTPGGQFLYCVNGADSAQIYNGTAWQQVTAISTPIAITGVASNLLISANLYKNRLFFVEKESFRVWYLPVNSVGGAAASLDFSPLFKLGGYLMAMMTWTIDNANGIQEYAIFISSEGEMVMYNGTDPATAGNWTILGTFRIGRPVGRRCYAKVGSDVVVICADGFFPLSKALLTDRAQLSDAISNKIVNLVNQDVQSYFSNFGWEACLYPIGNKLIFNVPQQEGATQYQYVMNTLNGSWCKFTAWNANCFAELNDVLYYGGNLGTTANSASVYIADDGYSDDGAYIFGDVKTAFKYYGAPGSLKRFTMARPVFYTAGTMNAALIIDVDFADNFPTASPTFSGSSGTLWNTSLWNTFLWASTSSIKKDWYGVTGIGYAGAMHMRIVNNKTPVQWQSYDVVYEVGGIL